jgi:hypothetical protein
MAEQTASLQNPGNTQGGPPAINPSAINPWFIAVTVTIAAFMELLDTSIANVALPYIGGGLGRSYDEVTWILTTYLVANAVVLPMTAWLSRLSDTRRITFFAWCCSLFHLSSVVLLRLLGSCWCGVLCRESVEADWLRSRRQSLSIPSRRQSVLRRLRCLPSLL